MIGEITLAHYLTVAGILFVFGVFGIFLFYLCTLNSIWMLRLVLFFLWESNTTFEMIPCMAAS